MNYPPHLDPIDILGEIYEKMYEHVADSLKHAKNISSDILHKAIIEAEEKASELEEISNEDARKLSDWLKRDLYDVANYLANTEYELKDWLGFETTLLETYAKYLLEKAADPTTVELLTLKENARKAGIYKTGEIAGPGALICDQCGEVLHFHKTAKIPPCPKCHEIVYHRSTSEL
jgi:hypothetical protein